MLPKIALDFGFVNPQAACHLAAAGWTRLAAAVAYTATKRSHNNTDGVCEAHGVDFQPVVFEAFGGIAKEGMDVLNCLNRLVANNTDTSYAAVAQRFWQGMSMTIQRVNHRAFMRRLGGQPEGLMDPGGVALAAAAVLDPAPSD